MENQSQKKANSKIFAWLFGLVVVMFGFGYLMVPIYNVLCDAWGLNGKTGGQIKTNAAQIDTSRWVTVEFVATTNAHLPWKFYPMEAKVKVHPGQTKQVAFFAENESGRTMTVQAIPSVSPGEVAKYMKKTECFCFNRQTFKSGESMEMPLIFHLDPDLPKNIHTVTLSYTMFDTAGVRDNSKNKTPGRIN